MLPSSCSCRSNPLTPPWPCLLPSARVTQMEFNPNDGPDKGDMPIRRAHERLIRKLLVHDRRPPLLEVIFCYWALDWME